MIKLTQSTHPKKIVKKKKKRDEIKKNKKNKKLFKDRWYQFQKNFNFEGRKNKFSRMVKNKGYHFSKKISNFKKEKKKKKLFQRTTKIN